MANTDAKVRIAKLRQLLDWIYSNRNKIYQAIYADFKKPAAEVDLSEVYMVVSEIKHAIRHLKKWMKPKRVRRTLALLTTSSCIHYEPRGVVLIIAPWNFPFNLTVGPLVSAIAAGNCIIVKPSEISLNTTRLIKEMAEQLFPENEVAVFEGDKEVAEELLKTPFDHIFFTGSPAVGKIVMKAAAENLATVTLELGGKSPVIVDDTANIKDAVQKIAWGKYMNNGQSCVAPDYLLIHESKYEKFMEEFKVKIKKYYGESETDRENSNDFARIINDRHHDRLKKMINDTVELGAKIEIGGVAKEEERYIAPTVLSNVSPESPAMQEEIFGPVLPVTTFSSLEEALKFINSKAPIPMENALLAASSMVGMEPFPSWRIRHASLRKGTKNRLTANPGESLTWIGIFPR